MRDDLKAAVRALLSSRSVTIAALAVLTLGIGAGTAIFSVVDAVVLRGLPFDEHDRLVAIGERGARVDAQDPAAVLLAAPQNYLDWTARQQAFESVVAVASGWLTLQEPGGEPESLVPQRVTANFFQVLRVRPAIGLPFTAANEVDGNHRVVVMSDAMWRRRFGGDPAIVGRRIRLEDVEGDIGAYEVVGVMPRGFTYPVGAARATDMWIPYVVPAADRVRSEGRRVNYLQVIARLSPGVTLSQAQRQMDTVAAALEGEHPRWNKDNRVGVRPLADHVVGASMRTWMLMLLGAVGIVLLIACANVANLLLSRAAARAREMGIRAALGAGRARLARQLLLESLLLSAVATACGLAFGWWVLDALKSSLPPSVPRVAAIALNLRVLAAASIAACTTAVVCGTAPALQLSRPDVTRALHDEARATAGRSRRRLRSALVVAELALALVLLVGAALFAGSFIALLRIAPGFDPAHVLTAQFTPRVETRPGGGYRDRRDGFSEVIARMEAVAGVRSAGMVDGGLPFGGATSMTTLRSVDGRMVFETINLREVTPHYCRALGIPVRSGRLFTDGDVASAAKVVILNEAAARHFFPGDPIGHVVDLDVERTVVGVVADIHQRNLEVTPWAEAYVPMAQFERTVTGAEIAVRTEGDPLPLLPAIKAAALTAFPGVPLRNVATMEELVARPMAQRRLNMQLLGLFGVLALVIAVVGLYALMAHVVAQRSREIGIRMALGATRGRVLGMVLFDATLLIAAGLALGGAAAWNLRTIAASFVFGLTVSDPRVFALPIVLLGTSALIASLVPARRAARADPVVALRS